MLFLNGQIKVAYYIECYKISLVFNDVTYLGRQKIGTVLSTIVDVNIYISVFKHYQLQMLLLKCSNTEIADIPLNSAIRLTWQDKWEFAMKQEFSRTDIYCLSRLFLSHKKSTQFTVSVWKLVRWLQASPAAVLLNGKGTGSGVWYERTHFLGYTMTCNWWR